MKKYVADDGSYLQIDESYKGVLRLAWYLPEDDDVGAFVGDRELTESKDETDDAKKLRWEITVATEAAQPFALGKSIEGFEFENMKQAKLALIAANSALLNGGAPMPDWAVKATEAGWKPPKGWKP